MFPIVAAISLGLLGSFHCIGMCGPIALALPVHNGSATRRALAVLLYNSGRIVTYSILGLLFGLIGKGFAIFGLQQFLSVALGVIILLSVIVPQRLLTKWNFTKNIFVWLGQVKAGLSYLFSRRNLSSLFLIGILNGLLPCGLVYMALAAALGISDPVHSAMFMALFGLGTVPVMLSLSWFSDLINLKFRNGIRKSMPYVISIMAVLMILRGLNLGIPYLSPSYHVNDNSVSCCEKPRVMECKKQAMECCHKK
jgi:sulfite exporter TauE/SafE